MILGVYGYQDSGKTTLVEDLVRELTASGFKVATVKHSERAETGDEKGKDTWRHARAGGNPVALLTGTGAVLRVRGHEPVERIVGLIEQAYSPDVLIIEGLKDGRYPKVSLGSIRPRKGTVMSNPTLNELLTHVKKEVAVEKVLRSLPRLDCHKCGLDCRSMAEAIVERRRKVSDCKELPSRDIVITVGGKRIATGTFVSEIVDDTIRGMLGSLKGYEPGKDVEIRLKAGRGKAKGSPAKRK